MFDGIENFVPGSLYKSWAAGVISMSSVPVSGLLMGRIQKERPHA
jgi:hypothetical protein